MRHVGAGIEQLAHLARDRVVGAEAPLLLDHLALGRQRLRRQIEIAHAIRLQIHDQIERRRRKVLVVGGHVLVGERVRESAVALERLVELLGAVFLGAVEHQVLEQVGDAGDARTLVARAHAIEGPEAHRGHRAVLAQVDA
jgi:hypothetical protein